MSKDSSSKLSGETIEIIREFVAEMLQDDIDPSEICFNLVAAGMELGLISAPSPEIAFALVSSALNQVNYSRAPNSEAGAEGKLETEKSGDDVIGEPATQTVH